MTKEMLQKELMDKVDNYNTLTAEYNKFKNRFGKTSEVFERSLAELETIIESLGKLVELYD